MSALLITSLPVFQLSSYAAEAADNVGATSGTTGDCTWVVENGVLTISGNGAMADYYYDYQDVPWKDCDFSKVIINDGVTNIGDGAFYYCDGLKSITIPDSVTSIGDYAFEDCRRLTSITIPDSVTSIGGYAFSGCDGLTSIIVDEKNVKYDSRNNCNAIIETESNSLIQGCKNTVIPIGVTSIESYAFSYCKGLTSITIPNSVTSIGDSAFSSCSGLTSITIPNSVTIIDESAFYNCNSLTDVYYYGRKKSWNEISIGDRNEELTSANIHFLSLYSIGDVNQNGRIGITDCTAIQYHLAWLKLLSEEQLELADVDDNGAVDIRDATLIQKYLAGFDVELAQ